jgi:hypothetical protein
MVDSPPSRSAVRDRLLLSAVLATAATIRLDDADANRCLQHGGSLMMTELW